MEREAIDASMIPITSCNTAVTQAVKVWRLRKVPAPAVFAGGRSLGRPSASPHPSRRGQDEIPGSSVGAIPVGSLPAPPPRSHVGPWDLAPAAVRSPRGPWDLALAAL